MNKRRLNYTLSLVAILSFLLVLGLSGCTTLTSGEKDFSGPTRGFGESSPDTFPLYAGQTISVGEVQVWNDSEKVCVKYQLSDDAIAEGWLIYETHFAVGATLGDIPQVKKGNPIPGQFPYGDDDLDGVESYQECVPLPAGVSCDDDIIIAAHSVVKKVGTFSECLVSGDRSDNVLLLAEDSENPGYPEGYTASYQTYSGDTTPSVVAYTHLSWVGISGVEWISSSRLTEDTDYNTWRLFTRNFDIPDNAFNISGTLTMNCDNAEQAYINSIFVGEDENAMVYGESIKDVYPPSGDAHGWSTLEGPWDISSLLKPGNNELWTMTRNYAWSSDSYTNPTGLTYKLCYQYDLVTEKETAWGGEVDFPGKNWATYFTYTVECEEPTPACSYETAWGGGTEGGGSTWWYYYDTSTGGEQTIWAGQDIDVGNVTVSGCSDDGKVTIEIELTGGWELKDVAEPVKIQGYSKLPDERPSAGLFTTYKGTSLQVTVDCSKYYAIHLDVQLCK